MLRTILAAASLYFMQAKACENITLPDGTNCPIVGLKVSNVIVHLLKYLHTYCISLYSFGGH